MSAIISSVDPFKQLKAACISKWLSGSFATSYINACFSYFSDPSSIVGKIDKASFTNGCKSIMPNTFTDDVWIAIFNNIDKNRSGDISYEEFSIKFQPMLSSKRRGLVSYAFDNLDTSKPADRSNPIIDVADISLPKYKSIGQSYHDARNLENLKILKKHIMTVLGKYNVNTVIYDGQVRKATIVEKKPKEHFEYTNVDKITYPEFINYYSDMSLRFINDKDFESFVYSQWNTRLIFSNSEWDVDRIEIMDLIPRKSFFL
jgi:Ca2+-binding EF-hand superfamily protein